VDDLLLRPIFIIDSGPRAFSDAEILTLAAAVVTPRPIRRGG
jgi:hypothetical protein